MPSSLPERLPDGRLLIPKRAEGPNGLVGDGAVVIGPGDPDWEKWDRYARSLSK